MLPVPLRPALTVRDVNGWSANGHWAAVDWHRWHRLDDRPEPDSQTCISVDRSAEPQAVRVISAPFMPDDPGASRRH